MPPSPLNGIFVRTSRGLELYDAAILAGSISVHRAASLAEFDIMQSHQVRKRRAVRARLNGMEKAGKPVPAVVGLRLEECAALNTPAENLAEERCARDRAKAGRPGEPRPVPRGG